MATFMENAYSLVHQDNTADQPTLQELKTHLEKGTDEVRTSFRGVVTSCALRHQIFHRFRCPSICSPAPN